MSGIAVQELENAHLNLAG